MLCAAFEMREPALVNFGDAGERADVFSVLRDRGTKVRHCADQIAHGSAKLARFYRQQLDGLRESLVTIHQPVQSFVDGHNPF